jgi:hypothetical protein
MWYQPAFIHEDIKRMHWASNIFFHHHTVLSSQHKYNLQSSIFNQQPHFTSLSSPPTKLNSAKMVSFTTSTVSVALVAALTMVQPIAAHGGFNFAPSLTLGRRTAQPASSDLEFAACQQAAATISPKPTYIIFANRTVDINGLPAVCISQLKTHNAQPNIAETNKWEGWGVVLNDTAIQVCLFCGSGRMELC